MIFGPISTGIRWTLGQKMTNSLLTSLVCYMLAYQVVFLISYFLEFRHWLVSLFVPPAPPNLQLEPLDLPATAMNYASMHISDNSDSLPIFIGSLINER